MNRTWTSRLALPLLASLALLLAACSDGSRPAPGSWESKFDHRFERIGSKADWQWSRESQGFDRIGRHSEQFWLRELRGTQVAGPTRLHNVVDAAADLTP